MEVEKAELGRAIERQHGGRASHIGSVLVEEAFEGKAVWHGLVYVYDLADNPNATRAYAWREPIEGSRNSRVVAVLGIGPIAGPVEAVRAYVVAQHRAKRGT